MKIYPHRDKAQHFQITDVEQELKNLIAGLQAMEPHHKSPWTKGTISAMERAIEDSRQFNLNSCWE